MINNILIQTVDINISLVSIKTSPFPEMFSSNSNTLSNSYSVISELFKVVGAYYDEELLIQMNSSEK